MPRVPSGRYEMSTVHGEQVRAFIPHPLPPKPPLLISDALREQLDLAHLALGRLDSVASLLPDTSLFLYHYVRKEAVLSSQIEGTKSSLSDLLLFELDEAPGVPIDDVSEVSNYVAALRHGLRRYREGLPISNRLIREIHGILLAAGRGGSKSPGQFRRSQNWIGGSRPGNAHVVPPPPSILQECMGALEKFIHDIPVRTPTLLKTALAHVQFETIRPFLDGNGRTGRLLITLLLCAERVLTEPLLYLSLYFKENRSVYYEKLDAVRTLGAWEDWIDFFARGVIQTAQGAVTTARRLGATVAMDRERVMSMGRSSGTALQVLTAFQEQPLLSISRLSQSTRLSQPAVTKALDRLGQLGVIREITGRRRGRIYSYVSYLQILSEGTEPL